MDQLTIAVLAIFLISFIVGMVRGAVKTAFSLFATILTIAIVWSVSPYVSDAIIENTQADEWIAGQVESRIESKFEDAGEEIIKEYIGDDAIDENQIAEYKEILGGDDIFEKLGISEQLENQVISDLELPDFVKELLADNNNEETYKKIGANGFVSYIGIYIAHILIQVGSYLLTLLAVRIVLAVLMFVLNIAAHLPVLGLVNRFLGGVINLGAAVIVIWIAMTVLMLAVTVGIGADLLDTVRTQPILQFLYQNNLIAKMAFGIY